MGATDSSLTLDIAVEQKIINNETLAYFMARTYQFLLACGIRPDGIRFRQHRKDEMAHYAQDCWDAEVETSYGWIEVAGHADRSCYDLSRHSEKTKVDLCAARLLKETKTIQFVRTTINKKALGPLFKGNAKKIMDELEGATDENLRAFMQEMEEKKEIVVAGEHKLDHTLV